MGTYVHIPFCHSKCAYCDFYSMPHLANADRLIAALGNECRMRSAEIGPAASSSIYIGGGPPSILSPAQFRTLVSFLPKPHPSAEFTVEANPEDISSQLVSPWLHCGGNRVSMGVQSLVDSELAEVGRRHSAAQAIAAYRSLRQAGVTNISLDLIYGLPGQSLNSWKHSVDTMMDLRPDHLSAYLLSFEPGTRLYARLLAGKVTEADEDLICAMYEYLCTAAAAHGYEHYEISNFSLPGKRAAHNSSYWNFSPYIGLGPSAHSFDGHTRRINPSSLTDYLQAIESGQTAFSVEEESDLDRLNDRIMVGLRTSDGLDLSAMDPAEVDAIRLRARAVPPSHLVWTPTSLRIPESSFLISDSIIRTLLKD